MQKQRQKFAAVSSEDSYGRTGAVEVLKTAKSAAATQLIDAAFESKGLFSHLTSAQRTSLYEIMQPVTVPCGTEIMRQGEDGDEYIVIEKGEADVYVAAPGQAGRGSVVATRVPGESVGELALMYGSPRNATIVAKTDVVGYVLTRNAFRQVLVGSTQRKKEEVHNFLRKVELLQKMNDRDLDRLADALETETFPAGTAIVTEGDTVAEFFYLIESGICSVTSEGEEVVRRTAGEYFGELALLKNVPRIATVTAVEGAVVTKTLSRTKFQNLFGVDTDWSARYEREAREQEESVAPARVSELSGQLGLQDFDIGPTLGFGAYGRVQLVTAKQNGKIYAMKILMKRHILDKKQVQHTKDEKNVISMLNHPFVVNLIVAFQDDFNLYLVLEFVNGGELYSLLQNKGKLSEPWARMYIGELALAFYYFSQLNIVYRDLKPENLLIDKEGHMKITDFGLAKVITSRTYTMCGTPDYLAPEIIKNQGHSRGVDYWALGIVCFEMLTGLPPFYQADGRSEQTFVYHCTLILPLRLLPLCCRLQRILKEKPKFPNGFPKVAKSFVLALLEQDTSKRLGCLAGGVQDILTHPWFDTVDWQKMADRRVPTHWKPPSTGENDTQNFDDYEHVRVPQTITFSLHPY